MSRENSWVCVKVELLCCQGANTVPRLKTGKSTPPTGKRRTIFWNHEHWMPTGERAENDFTKHSRITVHRGSTVPGTKRISTRDTRIYGCGPPTAAQWSETQHYGAGTVKRRQTTGPQAEHNRRDQGIRYGTKTTHQHTSKNQNM